MIISIIRRNLTESEIKSLINDIRLYPNLAYVSPARFRHLSKPYCVSVDGCFAGICGIYSFDTWIKLGPLVLLHRFHGLGVGRKLLDKIITDHKKTSIYIASSNPAVQHIITSHAFKQIPSYFQLPNKVKLFLLSQLVEHFNLNFLKEGLRKKFFQRRGETKFYVRLD